jgi:hypothetical protein
MKLNLDDFWGKRISLTWGSHFMQGTLSREKSNSSYITLVEVSPYTEFRIEHDAIDSIGLFEEG